MYAELNLHKQYPLAILSRCSKFYFYFLLTFQTATNFLSSLREDFYIANRNSCQPIFLKKIKLKPFFLKTPLFFSDFYYFQA